MDKRTRIARVVATLVGAIGALVFMCAMYYLGTVVRAAWDSEGSQTEQGVGTTERRGEGLVPCTDDSAPNYPCAWDSTTQGNGEGESFWVDEYGVTHTWEDA